jgi:hypothetical protein
MLLNDLSLDDLIADIELIGDWFRDNVEIEEERYHDRTYKTPEAFLRDLEGHKLQRDAMAKLLKVLEEERARRERYPTDSSAV